VPFISTVTVNNLVIVVIIERCYNKAD